MNRAMDERASESEFTESDEQDDDGLVEQYDTRASDENDIEPGDDDDVEPGEAELDDVEPGEAELDEEEDADADESDQRFSVSGPGADLEELVRYVASRLVQDTDDIEVESELRGGTVYVSLRVPEGEMGRVIGREGRTAKAIRTLVSIAGSRQNVHARLDIDG